LNNDNVNTRSAGFYVIVGALALAILAALGVLWHIERNPRTDDASVRANYVQFAPEVSGRVVSLAVKDNAYVHHGDLLFAIDPRPYEYVLQQALADQQLLDAQIGDAQRRIAAQSSAVEAARAGLSGSKTQTAVSESSVNASVAAVARARAAVESAEAQKKLALSNLNRIEPLLAKQYVTLRTTPTLKLWPPISRRRPRRHRRASPGRLRRMRCQPPTRDCNRAFMRWTLSTA
jgi:multidrug efflux system membrane fusion protein